MAYFQRRGIVPSLKRRTYQSFRAAVREDFRATCAYCLLEEKWAAGLENFEIDHFRPRSRFPHLALDFYNLYWSCHVCNRIKAANWPSAELQAKGIALVDLCSDDFDLHFAELANGKWHGKTASAEYTIEALRLNRAHLVALRQALLRLERRR